jgi:hypothetical protein
MQRLLPRLATHDDGHWDAEIEAYCLLDVLKPVDGRPIGSLALLPPISAVEGRRRPILGATGKPLFSCFVVVLDRDGLDRESDPIGEAVDINDGSAPSCRLTDGADIHAATPANKEIGCARAKPVRLDERPVLGPDLDGPVRIAGRAGVVGAAE